MSITYPLSFPSYMLPTKVEWVDINVVGVSRSPYTGKGQRYDWEAAWFTGTIYFPAFGNENADDAHGFLTSLRGRLGTMLVRGTYARTAPRGTAPGTPLVDGASQTGLELDTRGWTPSQTGILLRGDFIQLGTGSSSRLHKVMADADSDGSGDATLDIWPPLRTSPSDGQTVIISSPVGLFSLDTNRPGWNQTPPNNVQFSMPIVEWF